MDRIDAMRAFVASVDRGSLASAARRLGHSAATITRGIAMLERRLGMRLLHRSTRALHLTQFGETYLGTCREVLAALDAAERGAAAEQEKPSGMLTITAPLVFGQLHLRPVLDAFLDANPAVRARLLLLDRIANIVEEGIDLAVRVALKQSHGGSWLHPGDRCCRSRSALGWWSTPPRPPLILPSRATASHE